MLETEQLLARLHVEGVDRRPPGDVDDLLSHPLTAMADPLEEQLGPFVRVRVVSSACSSGATAAVIAAAWLLSGEVDVVLAGGCDGLCRLTLTGFNALGALDPKPCRPFDRHRSGTSLGEGAGFLVLELADHARARGASVIAELSGWAIGAEAHHITNPAPDGVVAGRLMRQALERAGLQPSDLDYVNAHGTGTPANDSMESAALHLALGDEVSRVPVSSSKGQLGHTLGAAGAIEAAITALVVSRRTLVPTAGLDEPDPALPLVHVPGVGRTVARVRAAMSNAFGFGGMGTVLVFTPERDRPARRAPAGAAGAMEDICVTGVALFGRPGRLGGAGCADLLDSPLATDPEPPEDTDPHLDPARARRLDRMARLGVVAVEHALREAGAPAESSGAVLGSAFGNVDACAAFMSRALESGPRMASPAAFPNLVPSSPVGHVSIYGGMVGPTFATADLAASGHAAFASAAQLVASGECARIVAGAAEPASPIVAQVLGPLFAHVASQKGASRSDLAAAVVVESARAARERGARSMARVRRVLEWRGSRRAAIGDLGPPRADRAEVVLSRADADLEACLADAGWGWAPRRICAATLGESDALGAAALAIGAARIAAGRAGEVLVVDEAVGRGYAVVLASP